MKANNSRKLCAALCCVACCSFVTVDAHMMQFAKERGTQFARKMFDSCKKLTGHKSVDQLAKEVVIYCALKKLEGYQKNIQFAQYVIEKLCDVANERGNDTFAQYAGLLLKACNLADKSLDSAKDNVGKHGQLGKSIEQKSQEHLLRYYGKIQGHFAAQR